MRSLFDPPFAVGERIVSTCGSLYRGHEGVVTAIDLYECPDDLTDADGWHYSVTIFAHDGTTHACGFATSQMVSADHDPGRAKDRPCESCNCRLKERCAVSR